MNTLKFQPIREKRQECYNLEDYQFNPFLFDGKEKQVYSNVNLSIFTDDYCNANCKFCVAQLRYEDKGQMYKKGRIAKTPLQDEEFYSIHSLETTTELCVMVPSHYVFPLNHLRL